MKVSYEKKMRDKAKAENRGLMTLSVIWPGKRPGKFGTSVLTQGPIDKGEADMVMKFIGKMIKRRQKAKVEAKHE